MGRPYLVELLDAGFLYDPDMSKDQMDSLDIWILSEIERRQLKPIKASYEEIFNGLADKMELSENLDTSEKIRLMANLLLEATEKSREYRDLGIDLESLE